MPATKISDLLPIPDGAKTPHPYQIFGLEGGEQDSAKIKAAVQDVYRRLKETKASADPEIWRKAAKLVEKARSILSDPDKRAALDARFGVIQFDDSADDHALQADDPLAGILPSTDPLGGGSAINDPLGAVVPAGDPMAVAAPVAPAVGMAPAGIAPTAPNPMAPAVPSPGQPSTPVAATPSPSVKKRPVMVKTADSSRRRKKSGLGTLMFATFMIGMFAVIGGVVYFILFGGGHISVVSKDGQISISTAAEEKEPAEVHHPRPARSTRPAVHRDPVLGTVPGGPSRPAGSLAEADPMRNGDLSVQNAIGSSPPMQPEPVEPTPMPVETTPAEGEPEVKPPPPTTEPPSEANPTPESETMLPVESGEQQSAPREMSDEMIAAAEAAISKVEKLIQQSDWKQMKSAAEKLTEMTLTDEQREYVEALYNLTDLATFYRGGIVKGIGTLQTASTFEVTEGVSVLVVETTPEGLTIRSNARNKTFTLDDMPFRLAEKLSSFALSPDKPDTIAARSCFQSISPQSTPEYRKDALTWLEFVNDDVEGVDTKQVAEAIKKLFPG